MALLEVIDLAKVYGDVAVVHDASFCVDTGQIVSLVGPNGAGKTTVLKMIAGLIKPSHGLIKIHGKEVRNSGNQPWIKRVLGFMPDTIIREDDLTGVEFLETLNRIQGSPPDREKINWALRTVGLHEAEVQRIREYSRGMRQRLNLAQVLVQDPDVFVLDEPLTAIDPPSQKLINQILLTMRSQGKGILMSSHSETTLEISDETLLMSSGRLIERQVTQHGVSVYTLRCSPPTLAVRVLEPLAQVKQIEIKDNFMQIWLWDTAESRREVLRALITAGVDIESFSPQTLSDIVFAGGTK